MASCPKCHGKGCVKDGIVKGRQRHRCKGCESKRLFMPFGYWQPYEHSVPAALHMQSNTKGRDLHGGRLQQPVAAPLGKVETESQVLQQKPRHAGMLGQAVHGLLE